MTDTVGLGDPLIVDPAMLKRTTVDGPGVSRDQRRSRRARSVKALTINFARLPLSIQARARQLYPDTGHWRPQTRADCRGVARPCPYVSCRHHLYLDVPRRTGALKLNFPDIEPHEMADSCSLDVADRGPQSLCDCGDMLNITRERTRQIEVMGMAKIKECKGSRELCEAGGGGRTLPPLPQHANEKQLYRPSRVWRIGGERFGTQGRRRKKFILEAVQLNPGVTLVELRQQLTGGESPSWFLQKLFEAGLLSRTGTARRYRYYAMEET